MSEIRFGCQTYTWQMSGKKYVGHLPHILRVVSDAGFAGLEPEVCMLGYYNQDASRLVDELKRTGTVLGALCLVCDWAGPGETDAERAEADRVIGYLRRFPETLLALCQMPGADRSDLRERQTNAIACVNAVARRAAEGGIRSAFHPNSPPGSVFRTADDYETLMSGLNGEAVGFAPDFGHIAKGGMDPVKTLEKYLPAVRHVHFKDMAKKGTWALMGRGVIDFRAIVARLRDAGYDGWIMVEDESPLAESDPDAATLENGKHVAESLRPLLGRQRG